MEKIVENEIVKLDTIPSSFRREADGNLVVNLSSSHSESVISLEGVKVRIWQVNQDIGASFTLESIIQLANDTNISKFEVVIAAILQEYGSAAAKLKQTRGIIELYPNQAEAKKDKLESLIQTILAADEFMMSVASTKAYNDYYQNQLLLEDRKSKPSVLKNYNG